MLKNETKTNLLTMLLRLNVVSSFQTTHAVSDLEIKYVINLNGIRVKEISMLPK